MPESRYVAILEEVACGWSKGTNAPWSRAPSLERVTSSYITIGLQAQERTPGCGNFKPKERGCSADHENVLRKRAGRECRV